jgi:hypothetical protein
MEENEENIYYYRIFIDNGKFMSIGTRTNVVLYLGFVKLKSKRGNYKEIKVPKKIAVELERLGCSKVILKVNGSLVDGMYKNQKIILQSNLLNLNDGIAEVVIIGGE